MKDVEALFLHELKDMYDAEQRLVTALQKNAKLATDPEVRQGFLEHSRETQRQTERLREVFKVVGKRPQKAECAGVIGLLKEASMFEKERPSPGIRDLFLLGAAQKVERYEITAYESLIDLAERAGFDDAVEPLRESLLEEQGMLERARSLAQDFDPEEVGSAEPSRRGRSAKGRATKARSGRPRARAR